MILGMHNGLMEETLRLAKETKLSAVEVCEAAGIKRRWYYRFLAGDFHEPGVNKILRLHRVLAEAKRGRLRPQKETVGEAAA